MKRLMQKIESVMAHTTMFDIGVLKLCLLALGIIFGVYFVNFFSNILLIVWLIFGLTWLYIVIKVFGFYWKKST